MSDNKIKTFRKQQNLSQEQLAEKAQVSLRTIQRLEAGEETNTTTLNLVAGALGVEVSDLASNDDSEQHQAKLADADEQLQLQLHDRHDEYKMYRTF
ncbi:MAG: helix-turn-helix transcriptional regulator, partial [Limosilactobacillus sp.]|nr:helix-turn-helix transcriptional regulator [Limosilactobacillus sp.]